MAKKCDVSKNAIEIITHLNNTLFDAEQELEDVKRQVSANRWYFAANPTKDNVLDLRNAMQRMKVLEEKVSNTKRSLDKAITDIYSL